MTGIYKITNIITGKLYVGQAYNIKCRWKTHKNVYNNSNRKEYNYHIYRAMRKYGIDNFVFEVIEECSIDELDNREKYWITYYDSYRNGYNETLGGNGGVHGVKITLDMLDEIDINLKQLISIQEIADKFSVSYEMIQGINTGRYWHRDNIDYPIGKYPRGLTYSKLMNRNMGEYVKEVKHCIDCGKEISSSSRGRCVECARIFSRKTERPDLFSLVKLVASTPMIRIGKMFNVSDNAVRKWCDMYKIPKKKNEAIEYMKFFDDVIYSI